MLIISINTYAEESEYAWQIEKVQDKGVMYSKNGEYVWGDRIYFIKESKDCEQDFIIFTWSSDDDGYELNNTNLFTLFLDDLELKNPTGNRYKLAADLQNISTIAGTLKALHYSTVEIEPWIKSKLLSTKELKIKSDIKKLHLDTEAYDFTEFNKINKQAYDLCKKI